MHAVDTNVIVRYLTGDHPQQYARARGLIDTRAIVYFVSIATLCLLVAFHALERRKWS